jgi:hypothetical protein
MISLTFENFRNGSYPEEFDVDAELYVVKNETKVLYVGISHQGIWNRWFSRLGHMPTNAYGEHYYTSLIAREILEKEPESMKWIIELWTKEDCIRFINDESIKCAPDAIKIDSLEPRMIEKLKPFWNSTYAQYLRPLENS